MTQLSQSKFALTIDFWHFNNQSFLLNLTVVADYHWFFFNQPSVSRSKGFVLIRESILLSRDSNSDVEKVFGWFRTHCYRCVFFNYFVYINVHVSGSNQNRVNTVFTMLQSRKAISWFNATFKVIESISSETKDFRTTP